MDLSGGVDVKLFQDNSDPVHIQDIIRRKNSGLARLASTTYRHEFKMVVLARKEGGPAVDGLQCQTCNSVITNARSVKEHLSSKKHQKCKMNTEVGAKVSLKRLAKKVKVEPQENVPLTVQPSVGSALALFPLPIKAESTPLVLGKNENNHETTLNCSPGNTIRLRSKLPLNPMFADFWSTKLFADITLSCEGRTIKCHKLILSKWSTYFKNILTAYGQDSNQYPIIILTTMKYWELRTLVNFMYKGEIVVRQENLQSLLEAAKSLQIKELSSCKIMQQ